MQRQDNRQRDGGSGVAGPWVSAAGQTLTITLSGTRTSRIRRYRVRARGRGDTTRRRSSAIRFGTAGRCRSRWVTADGDFVGRPVDQATVRPNVPLCALSSGPTGALDASVAGELGGLTAGQRQAI